MLYVVGKPRFMRLGRLQRSLFVARMMPMYDSNHIRRRLARILGSFLRFGHYS